MSEHEHLDPRLDDAFAAFTRDLAHAPSPGAAAAISTARRHRRTRVGGVALAALLAVGGGLAVPGLVGAGDGVAAGGGSARFDRDALAAATDGWIGEWEDWERYSPWGGGGFGAEACATPVSATSAPQPTSTGVSRFVSHSGASAVVVVEGFADATTAREAQDRALPSPDTCGTTTTYDVDGVEVRHDSMPPDGDAADDMWLGDVWSARIGDARAELQLVNDAGVADDATVERVAEALVAGLRDGWTQESNDVVPQAEGKGDLPAWPGADVERALAGWHAAGRMTATGTPNTPCLGESLQSGAVSTETGGTPRGVTHRFAGYADDTSGPEKIETMLAELRACRDAQMRVATLANDVHVATYDTGGAAGRAALWFAAEGDRAALVAVEGADRPMPPGVEEDVADELRAALRLPWE